jgi:putative DNA-invertase from lambdoid prophage Rac
VQCYRLTRPGHIRQACLSDGCRQHGKNSILPTGKLVFHVIGAVAEFEKDIIRERVRAGLANARRKGKTLGRPPKPNTTREEAGSLYKEGLSYRAIGRKLKIAESTVRNWLKKANP